ncbi:hypothetical protein NDI76_13790 [Halogeometricum sp. S1BR25-6]|uniref:Ig-like domain-containing protein n=1 Tax=Halogeometricum salsisoli TaxID=2950536 RepID=A0ABU2GG75_9EURY|nr:hypothetical protein [Halogeometricum sp. S1BR25-6]MDS0299816.1 hypothetical protein [Halogeometricum sp. S1BR25-6]
MPTRRRILAALAAVGSAGVAGCDGLGDGRATTRRTTAEPGDGGVETGPETGGPSVDAVPDEESSLPYRAGDDGENVERPLGLVVRNVGSETRFATVVVSRGEETLFVDSAEYAPEGTDRTRRYPSLVARRGVYDVFAETDDGATGSGTLRVDGVHADATVELDGDVRVRQAVRCAPDCGPVSVGGDARPFGNPRWPEVDAWAGYGVTVANAGADRREVRVEFEIDDRTALDYRYRPPPGSVLTFPTVPPLRRLRVTVETAGDRWSGRLDEDRSVALPLAVDADGVRIDAWPDAGADLRFRNEGERRVAGIVLRRDGERAAAWSSELSPGETATVAEFVPGPGLYRAEMSVSGDGETLAKTRTLVVTRRNTLLVRAREGVDAFLVR